jgi:uncharacterized protein (DUF1501 family)
MKRRDFLKVAPAVSLPLILNGFPLSTNAGNSLLEMIAQASLANGRVLVIVQMNGGNDGLNTVLPIDKYAALNNARPNIVVPQSSILSLTGTTATGLHPALAEMRNMYNNGLLNISQAVSYPNPNFSHFRATDIWFTASAADVNLNTGWLGRHLNQEFPGFPAAYPNSTMPDPVSLQIGSQASIMTQGPITNMSMTVRNPDNFYNLVNGIVDPAPATPYGNELTFLRLIKQQTSAYTTSVRTAYNGAATQSTLYPADNTLAQQLRIVARLIKGGLKTPVYIVNHPDSFDTHAGQVDAADKTKGNHADLLTIVSKAIGAFQDDLQKMGIDDRVTGMTFTEFGRRIKSNNSNGTDHGTTTPLFVFGKAVNPIIIGTSPDIPANATVQDNIPMQQDFRAIYYTVLKDWFQLTPAQLDTVLFQQFTPLPIFKAAAPLPVTLISFKAKWGNTNDAVITWEVDEESNIDAYDVMRSDDGVNFTKSGTVPAVNIGGRHEYNYTDRNLNKNLYYYRLQINERSGSSRFSETALLKKNPDQRAVRIKVMPNPIREIFTVSFEEKITGLVTARIIDSSGREVWKNQTQAGGYNVSFRLEGKPLAAGVYTMQIIAGNEEGIIKILKQ